ncbi:FtsX-like permease family protein [Corynebacterium pacaense]|uniref:FtsX-like permease family protein n=1 Tax=Corynebacterium pacaense TaxID=1816684 RepID=UPI0009BBC601|nr:FtsX-like permease family protein [Corynebacterium pacaense]
MSVLASATRPTRRDVLRHPLRSLAAILLVAVPVALVTIGMISSESETAASFLGSPRTTASYSGGSCEQSVDGHLFQCEPAVSQSSEYDLLRSNLPEGFTVELRLSGSVRASFGQNSENIFLTQNNSSQAPAPGEILVPKRILDDLGAGVGDVLTMDERTSVRVAGVTPSGTALVAEPTLLAPERYSSTAETGFYGSWVISGPEAFTWDDVLKLNAVGFVVNSQDAIDNPPPSEAVPLFSDERPSPGFGDVLLAAVWAIPIVIVAFLALMLISPVFTISASRQTRTFALLASQGATPGHIRLAVLVYGLFAGVSGAGVGVLLGGIGTSLWWILTYPQWPLTIPWLSLAAVFALAVAASTAAAFLPALIAGRSSIVRGIQGGGADRIMRWRPWMGIGPVTLTVLGILFLYLSLTATSRTVFQTGYVAWREIAGIIGTLLAVVAVAATAPALIWLIGRLRGGLALRLASRDLLRQSLRSIPAIAALGSIIFIATVLSVGDRANSEANIVATESVFPDGTMMLALENGMPEDLDASVSTVESVLGRTHRVDVYGARNQESWSTLEPISDLDPNSSWVSGLSDAFNSPMLLASPELLEFFRAGEADLSGSAALVSIQAEPEDSVVYSLLEYLPNRPEPAATATADLQRRPVLPVLMQDTLLTRDALAELDGQPEYLGALLRAEQPVGAQRQQQLGEMINGSAAGVALSFPTWALDDGSGARVLSTALAALVIVVMTLVLALSAQQIRGQRIVLDAVGAPPNLCGLANALFGGLCALGAGLLGLVSGHIAAILNASHSLGDDAGHTLRYGSLGFIEPAWLLILGLVVVAPGVSAAIGWILTPRADMSGYRD